MQLHDWYSAATPSQRLAAEARHMRLGRIAANAKRPPLPVSEVVLVPKEPESFDDWTRRQERINPLPKAPWFSIECEIDAPEPVRPKIEDIQRAVCKHYGVTRTDMLSGRRNGAIILPRQIAVYICKKLTTRSLPEIGRKFGGRDHTTQIHSIRKISVMIAADADFAADVEGIICSIGGADA